jgi:hypothetical protein
MKEKRKRGEKLMEMPIEKKESKTGAIIGTVAAIVLCGLTGLCLLCPASIVIFSGMQEQLGYYFSNWYGIIPFCLSVIGIAIGVAVPIVLLRKKKAPVAEEVLPQSEPLPPVS